MKEIVFLFLHIESYRSEDPPSDRDPLLFLLCLILLEKIVFLKYKYIYIYIFTTISFGSRIGMRILRLISDVITFFSSTISRGFFIYYIYQMSKKKKRIGRNLEGMIVETTTIERKMKNRLPHEKSLHPSYTIPPRCSDRFSSDSVLIFCLPFLRFLIMCYSPSRKNAD